MDETSELLTQVKQDVSCSGIWLRNAAHCVKEDLLQQQTLKTRHQDMPAGTNDDGVHRESVGRVETEQLIHTQGQNTTALCN